MKTPDKRNFSLEIFLGALLVAALISVATSGTADIRDLPNQ